MAAVAGTQVFSPVSSLDLKGIHVQRQYSRTTSVWRCRPRTCSFCNALSGPCSNAAGLRNHAFGSPIKKMRSKHKSFSLNFPRRKGVVTAELPAAQGVAGIVEGVKWAFTSPATWESAGIATSTYFVLSAPLLLVGLSLSGITSAYALAVLTWRAFGGPGALIVSLYFVLGTAATKVNMKQKEAVGIAEKKGGRRGPASVFGSWTAGTLCALAAIGGVGGFEWKALWQLGFLASFCTKLSDTISSEIGKAYGKTTYLVTTFSIVPRGTEGAVSLEGTLAGLLASALLAAFAFTIDLTDGKGAIISVLAAQIANLCESYVGAAFQGREGYEWLNNDVANILNITIGAALAIWIRLLS